MLFKKLLLHTYKMSDNFAFKYQYLAKTLYYIKIRDRKINLILKLFI